MHVGASLSRVHEETRGFPFFWPTSIVLGSESPVKAGLPWIVPVKLMVALEHRFHLSLIGRIAFDHPTIEHQRGLAAGDLVAKSGLAASRLGRYAPQKYLLSGTFSPCKNLLH